MRVSAVVSGLICLLATWHAVATPGDGAAARQWTSAGGKFRVSYTSALQPMAINRIHHWIVRVESAGGDAVDGATIVVKGGMPAHNHGLPTQPRVTETRHEGEYRLEGLRFHMPGYWEIVLTISDGSVSDTVLIPLDL